MHRVWRDEPSSTELSNAASELGLMDFDSEKVDYLVAQLEDVFSDLKATGSHLTSANGCKVSLDITLAQISLTVDLTKDVSWKMKAMTCDSQTSKSFFSSLCLAGFANHSFLLFQIQQLREAIRVKDQYTVYLEENYKTINGTELMDKYKRQNPEEKDVLGADFLAAFAENVAKDYKTKLGADPKSLPLAIEDRETWKASKRAVAEPAESHKRAKRVHEDDSENLTHKVKKENPRPMVVPVNSKARARKRSQIGYIKRK